MILLNQVNADTVSESFLSRGGSAVINVRADSYGGGTVTVRMASSNDPSGRYIILEDGSFTADATVKLDYLPSGALIQVELMGSTGASNVFVDILQ